MLPSSPPGVAGASPGVSPTAAVPHVALVPDLRRPIAVTLRAYIRLTKPRIVELLLVTAVPPMMLAAGGWPATGTVLAVVVGGALAAGGANAVNCWLERDRDALMRRTSGRPLPAGDLAPGRALVFGIVLNVVAFALLGTTVNLLAATLTLSATLFYVFVYTIWLKPRTVHNIVIGGAAGAVPVLVGWAGVTGRVGAPSLVLFAVVFCWTPSHFWALALKYRDDYATAGVPMLPVVRGPAAAARQILAYALLTVACTLALGLVADVGVVYVVAAAVLGAGFAGAALHLLSDPSPHRAVRFFGLSNLYLAAVFAALAVDTLTR